MKKRAALWSLLSSLLLLLGGGCAAATANAQQPPLCTSDDGPAPNRLVERFINADCAACWRDPVMPSGADDPPGTVALDWIAPGLQAEQGALFAAARIDALARLNALGRPLPARSDRVARQTVSTDAAAPPRLRVAHGLPVGNYLGTSIEWRHAPPGHWRAWLLMIEALPAGTAGSPIARGLVRNSLRLDWTVTASNGDGAPVVRSELRPMQIPVGAQPDRLAVVGLIESVGQDASGAPLGLAALARSSCAAQRARP